MLATLLASIARNPESLAEAESALAEGLRARQLFFGDAVLPTYPIPFLVPHERLARWIEQITTLATAIETVAQLALVEPDLFAILRLRPEALELVRVDPGYRRITTLCRADAIPRDDTLTFFEFNCDSPAMMNFADGVSECLTELPLLRAVCHRTRPEQMTGHLLQTLLECYREFGGTRWPPEIAITDWPGQKTRFEHRSIANHFEAAGYPTVVCDPRAFRRAGKRLEVEGHSIDIVYRRALFGELLERQEEVQPLLGAYRDGTICMVNSLRSYLASSKSLFAFLCAEGSLQSSFPSFALCRQHVARTWLLGAEEISPLRDSPRRYVLKRCESHGGEDVLLPDCASDAQWQQALEEALQSPWIMQEYHPVPKLDLPAIRQGRLVHEKKLFNWNPFIFGGRYAGGIARASNSPLINISQGGGLLPTFPYV